MERLTFEGLFCDIAKCQETPGGSFCENGMCSQRKVWERLKYYEDMEEQGRLFASPVKIDQTVWFIRPLDKKEITETVVEKIVVKGKGLYMKLACNAMYETSCNSIGKTVFLTREEAENALATDKECREQNGGAT